MRDNIYWIPFLVAIYVSVLTGCDDDGCPMRPGFSLSENSYSEEVLDGGINPTPVPEPVTALLFGGGVVGFVLFRKRMEERE